MADETSTKDAGAEWDSAATAGGKLILLGEHAVVYGHTALAGAIDRRVRISARASSGPSSLHIDSWAIRVKADDEGAPAEALRALLAAASASSVALSGTSDLPPAAGLGSSAALCLAIARCLAPDASDAEHRTIAAAGEAAFHDRPSGIDVALCQHGGIAEYSRAGGLVALDVAPLPLVVGLSGVSRSTAEQVGIVSRALEAKNSSVRRAIDEMGELARAGTAALKARDFQNLGSCMSRCHEQLRIAGVSIGELDQMVEAATGAGALGAKLTGAGGGGAMIALAPGREDDVCQALKRLGYEAFATTLGIS